jgi:hypothetical protein
MITASSTKGSPHSQRTSITATANIGAQSSATAHPRRPSKQTAATKPAISNGGTR